MAKTNVLLVTFPAQGHLNPTLQFAKRLAKHGVNVTFLTSQSAIRRMSTATFSSSLQFLPFDDGFDDGWTGGDVENFMSELAIHGSKAVEDAIVDSREHGRPFARVISTLLVPWAGLVARRLQIPVTLLWYQPAVLFGVYFYYSRFNHYFDSASRENGVLIELPGLPAMEFVDLPSFIQDPNSSVNDFIIKTFCQNFEILDGENHPTVLLNTFNELEPEALKAIERYNLLAIGPLLPSAFLDRNDPSDNSFGGDLIQNSSPNYIPWLDSKPKSSVIYVAFGSYSELSRPQMEEIAKGLIKTGRPFLWVVRGSDKSEKEEEEFLLGYRDELEKQGKMVPWCTQVEVLSHPSVGCFFTHCGWNSSLESLVTGVPVVALPQWTDQFTNAKLIEDLWRTGVRAVRGGGDGVVDGDEIERCVEMVMRGGERGEEMRREGKKWRDLAVEAVKEDGSSNGNLNIFLDQLLHSHEQAVS